jgi:3-phenylpropionate/trans-cinnamate dioxygenase ferredoxin reductase subunit
VVELSNRILQRVTGEKMSAYLTELHESNGVRLLTGASVSQFEGDDQITAVVCSNGSRFDVDFVVAGVGISPEKSLAEECGLNVGDGIIVDEFGCTSDPMIYAAGDCAFHPNELYGRGLRLESVQNANDQARVIASNICGKQVPYNSVPWFWSDQYETKLQMVGLSEGHDEIICRGNADLADKSGFAFFYLKKGVVIASECVGRPKEFMFSKKLIGEQIKIETTLLSDESIAPSEWCD